VPRTRAARSAAYRLDATWLQVQGLVAQEYYQLVADLALVAASRAALDVSREGLALARAETARGCRRGVGVDSRPRGCRAAVSATRRCELQVTLTARALDSASNVAARRLRRGAPDRRPAPGARAELVPERRRGSSFGRCGCSEHAMRQQWRPTHGGLRS